MERQRITFVSGFSPATKWVSGTRSGLAAVHVPAEPSYSSLNTSDIFHGTTLAHNSKKKGWWGENADI